MTRKKPVSPVKVDLFRRSLARRRPMRSAEVPLLTSRKYRELYFKGRGPGETSYW